MCKKIILLILISYSLLFIAGITSEICLGDEVHYYRFAKLIYQNGKIITQDPLYADIASWPIYLFLTPPLWHVLLVILWKLTGGISPYIAQIYHGLYYVLLILFTYLLAKTLYTDQDGWYSAIIIAICPVVISFSILFYMDLPLTTFTTLSFLLLFKKRYFLAGLVLGLMYLIKMNSAFFIPIFLILIFYFTKDKIIEKIKRLFCFFTIPIIGLAIYDICWRNKNFSNYLVIGGFGNLNKVIRERIIVARNPFRFFEYTNSSFFNPIDLAKYLGLIILISLILYFVFKKYEKKDKLLWISIGVYMLLFIFIFVASDIRYMMPIIPLLAILASKPLKDFLNKKWLKIIFLFICIIQFSATLLYVNIQRRIPLGIKKGFNFIKQNVPQDALIMYPEENLLEATNRRIIWSSMKEWSDLFWSKNNQDIINTIKLNKINYIAIKKSRIYDDSKLHHMGGYPLTFINHLKEWNFAELIFDNKEMSIWKIKLLR